MDDQKLTYIIQSQSSANTANLVRIGLTESLKIKNNKYKTETEHKRPSAAGGLISYELVILENYC